MCKACTGDEFVVIYVQMDLSCKIKLSAKKNYSSVNKSRVDLIISIQDTGIGIPEEQQSIIFELKKSNGLSALFIR